MIYNLVVNILDIYLHVLEESKSKNKKSLSNTNLCIFIFE